MNAISIGILIATATVLITCARGIKSAFVSLQKVWLGTVQLDRLLSSAVYRYCMDTMKVSRFRSKVYNGCVGYKSGSKKEDAFIFDILSQSFIVFWKGFRCVVMAPGNWKYDETTGSYERTVNLYVPRFFWDLDNFIKDAVARYNNIKIADKRFGITRFQGKHNTMNFVLDESKKPNALLVGSRAMIREAQMGRAVVVGHDLDSIVFDGMGRCKPFDWYAFNDDVMAVVEQTREWFVQKWWYKEKHIPWRRGIVACGKPGSGKTLLLKCIAEDLDIPIFCFDIGSMNNEEFVKFWGEASLHAPCMILMEDFDSVFCGRENKMDYENKMSFDCLLNCISGVETTDGILLGITSNRPECLDEALIRPGRIDEKIELNEMAEKCRKVMVQRILSVDGDNLQQIVARTAGMTAAEFTNECRNIVLNKRKKVA